MKKLKSSEVPQRDRLSELPDSLIHEILSLLPIRDVVRTTILSKCWQDVWTNVPCLNICHVKDREVTYQELETFRNFVKQALKVSKTKILKFGVDFHFDPVCTSDLDEWLGVAVEIEVEELDLSLIDVEDVKSGYGFDGYCLPQCLYSCSSIRKLSLVGCSLEINGTVQWSQLKSLRIDGMKVTEHDIDQILSGTPQLEILMLRVMEIYENLNIQSSSLKKMMIEKYLYIDHDPAEDTALRIWAPNLETLEIAGVPYSKCLLINVSSLNDATLDFYVPNHYENYSPLDALCEETLRQIFPTIHHVKKVTLSECCIGVIGMIERRYLFSSSLDAKFLKLKASFLFLDEMVFLLENFPKLEMFVIEHMDDLLTEVSDQTFRERFFNEERDYLESKTDLPMSFLLQLRTVEITWLLCDALIFPLIEFLLTHASMLEKLVVRGRRIGSLAPDSVFLAAAQKLLSMQRSFPTVELILCEK